MKTKRFFQNGLVREYHVFGEGSRVLYAFHGFGRPAAEWKSFELWLGSKFTIYAFADFFHGESVFPSNRIANDPLKKEEIVAYFELFAKENKHKELNLMAHSSGGRTALTLIEKSDLTIDEVWLFAPDGVKRSFWNTLFCKSRMIQKLYKKIIKKPDFLFWLSQKLPRIGLLNKDLASFVLLNMRHEERRQQIYNYWMCYKEIVPHIDTLVKQVQNNNVKLHLLFGKNDHVIESKIGIDLNERIGSASDFLALDGGHLLIDAQYQELLMNRYS